MANAYNNVQTTSYQLTVFVLISTNVHLVIIIITYMLKDFHNTESVQKIAIAKLQHKKVDHMFAQVVHLVKFLIIIVIIE